MEEWKVFKVSQRNVWEVSDLGQVRKNGLLQTWPLNKKGYFTHRHFHLLHRLVANYFIPNLADKPCVNHINGNRLDNRVENLEWTTWAENNQHTWDTGRQRPYGFHSKKSSAVPN